MGRGAFLSSPVALVGLAACIELGEEYIQPKPGALLPMQCCMSSRERRAREARIDASPHASWTAVLDQIPAGPAWRQALMTLRAQRKLSEAMGGGGGDGDEAGRWEGS